MNLSFDDTLIVPQFSTIKSRKDVSTTVEMGNDKLRLGVISSNMDTVTGPAMSKAMLGYGAQACLHRFQTIDQNVEMFRNSLNWDAENSRPWVSIGLGEKEFERAVALYNAGAHTLLVDVAHGASMEVVKQVKQLQGLVGSHTAIVVGNFATAQSTRDFLYHLGNRDIQALKISIGSGSSCSTRIVTGCGMPLLSSLLECKSIGIPMIADGGIRNSGDAAKAFAAGASAIMLGKMLAGSYESPGEIVNRDNVPCNSVSFSTITGVYKRYRGSASAESYKVQGKEASHRTPEGGSFLVKYSGPVVDTLQTIEAGLRSSMSYVGAHTIKEFQEKAKFIQITNAGLVESSLHGKNDQS